MKYALNIKKGTTINHPSVGKIPGGIAVEVTDKEAIQIKNIINIIIFDSIETRITGEIKNDGNTTKHKR